MKIIYLQRFSCGDRTRTYDLWVMSPTSYHCSTPRLIVVQKYCFLFKKQTLLCISLKINMKPLSKCIFLYIYTLYVFMCINNYVSV